MSKSLSSMLLLHMVLGVLISPAVFAQVEQNQINPSKNGSSIHIVSDQLTVDTQKMTAEFSGHVRAVREDMVMEADELTVFYDKKIVKADTEETDEQSLRKIIAKGSVRIRFDNRVAVADEAVYTAADRILTLTGKEVKISGEKDSIQGEKIIINRNDEKMTVIRSQFKQVEAVFTEGGNRIK